LTEDALEAFLEDSFDTAVFLGSSPASALFACRAALDAETMLRECYVAKRWKWEKAKEGQQNFLGGAAGALSIGAELLAEVAQAKGRKRSQPMIQHVTEARYFSILNEGLGVTRLGSGSKQTTTCTDRMQ
jgi:hypothetical protein